MSTHVLVGLRSERQTLDEQRQQLEGEALIDQLFRAYRVNADPALVLGVTNYDLFWAGARNDRFAFAVRAGERYAVVSTARMDPSNYGQDTDPKLLRERLEKMILRYVAELYFRLPRVGNKRSVLRQSIRSLSDLDEMTPAFCPDRPRALQGC